ncbi:MAG: MFS transporter [Sphingobium sp.]
MPIDSDTVSHSPSAPTSPPTPPPLPDPRELILQNPMSRAQKGAIMITMLVTATDGFDMLSAAFAAPGMVADWGVDPAALGIVLSMNLVGMTLGALFLAPLADIFGRRRQVLAGLAIVAGSMFATALANSVPVMSFLRLMTGLGVGAMVGANIAIATENANARNRALTVALMSVGMPIGGAIGGTIAAWLLQMFGWHPVFLLGGSMSLAVLILAFFILPESVDFLIRRDTPRAREELRRTMRRFGHGDDYAAPVVVPQAKPAARVPLAGIFTADMRVLTLAMAGINFTQMFTTYYFLNWLPQIVVNHGYSAADGAITSVWMNSGGIVGALLIGWMARYYPVARVVLASIAGTVAGVMMMVFVPGQLMVMKIAAALVGMTALGAASGIYALFAQTFPAPIRASGIGFSFSVGRLGSILATTIAGVLFASGLGFAPVTFLMTGGSIAALIILCAIVMPAQRRKRTAAAAQMV